MNLPLVVFLASGAAYFDFNWRYFTLLTKAQGLKRMRLGIVLGAFAVNYLLFFACSILELNLVMNWGLFFVFLLGETLLYCGKCRRGALLFPLTGILFGLTMNIFCRCAVSLAFHQPLSAFDNHISSAENLKSLPVILGFATGGAVLHLLARPAAIQRYRVLLAHPEHLRFQVELMAGMFLYLFLNLLLYRSQSNGPLLKVWGIKSCVFATVGTYLSSRYALEMCELSDYREQNHAIRKKLAHREREEEDLRLIAYRDMLTGAYNRQYALESIARLLGRHSQLVLCFVDLNDLKAVNDRYGHAEGDRYLATVARELARACRKDRDLLFRYGGDEFLILFPGARLEVVEERMRIVERRLEQASGEGKSPFAMAISYGAVETDGSADADALIRAADQKMYQNKRAKGAR